MAQVWYEDWYNKDVSPKLTTEQKQELMHKISDMTLKEPIWTDKDRNFIEEFPELKPCSNSGRITGLQLVTLMECCLRDLQRA